MNWEKVLEMVWTALNSPAGVTAMASVVLYLLNKLYAAQPAWQKYEGTIITAIKFAEKHIPDGTENQGLLRLDHALKYVLRVYWEATGQPAKSHVANELKEAIQVKHAELEASGNL